MLIPFSPMRGIPNSLNTSLRQLLAMYVVAVLFNYPWERVQSSLYVGMDGANAASWLCLLASLIDGLLVLVIFTAGCFIFRRRDWFKNPGISGYVLMVVTGFMISIGVEWTTLHLGQWWEYTAQCRSCLGSVLGLRLLLRCSSCHRLFFAL